MASPPDKALRLERSSRGGKKGGPARARALSAERRSEIARMGALATNRKRQLKTPEERSEHSRRAWVTRRAKLKKQERQAA